MEVLIEVVEGAVVARPLGVPRGWRVVENSLREAVVVLCLLVHSIVEGEGV